MPVIWFLTDSSNLGWEGLGLLAAGVAGWFAYCTWTPSGQARVERAKRSRDA